MINKFQDMCCRLFEEKTQTYGVQPRDVRPRARINRVSSQRGTLFFQTSTSTNRMQSLICVYIRRVEWPLADIFRVDWLSRRAASLLSLSWVLTQSTVERRVLYHKCKVSGLTELSTCMHAYSATQGTGVTFKLICRRVFSDAFNSFARKAKQPGMHNVSLYI